ncbi:hypothetical protein WJX84_000393 [Apatococcus fuscideae]
MVGKRNKRVRPDGKHIQNLGEQLEDPAQNGVRTEARPSSKRRRWMADQVPGEDTEQGLDAATSNRIMEAAKAQQEEMEAEDAAAQSLPGLPTGPGKGQKLLQQLAEDSDDDDDGTDAFSDAGSLGGWDKEEEEISPEDQRALAAFMAPEGQLGQQRTLADLILDKIKASKPDGAASAVPT